MFLLLVWYFFSSRQNMADQKTPTATSSKHFSARDIAITIAVLIVAGVCVFYGAYTYDGGYMVLEYSNEVELRTSTCCHQETEIPRVVFQCTNTDVVVRRYMRYRSYIIIHNHVQLHVYNDSLVSHYMNTYTAIEGVSDAFAVITKGAIKADLFRWAYAYEHGGIWMDMDTWTEYKLPIDYNTDELVVLVKEKCIQAHFFAARAKHPIVKLIVQQAISNIISNQFSEYKYCHDKHAAGWAGPIVATMVIHNLIKNQFDSGVYRKTYHGIVDEEAYQLTIINQKYISQPTVIHKRWFGANHDIKKTFKLNNTWSQTSGY